MKFKKTYISNEIFNSCQKLVRFRAYYRIKPHAPPLVSVPVNSFEFQPCESYSSGGVLNALAWDLKLVLSPSTHRLLQWTTRVSNPFCSPCFRSSASVINQTVAFATRCSFTYLRIPSLLVKFHYSLLNSSKVVLKTYLKLSFKFSFSTFDTACELFTPNYSG